MRFAVHTLGCKVNQYETQAMEQELLFSLKTEEQFPFYFLNMKCTELSWLNQWCNKPATFKVKGTKF